MRYNKLGTTGLFVSELCLGTMTFGGKGLFKVVGQVPQDEADELVKTAIDGGINFLDTANVYSEGMSEEITGQALKNLGIARSDVVIATKVLGPMGEGPNDKGLSRYHIMNQAEASLERLQTDHIDLYQIHGWDPATPMEETLRAFEDLVSSGMVRYIGVSNWAAWQIAKALGIAATNGYSRFETVQAYYTIAGRDLEREIVPMMQSEGLGLLVWSPLAGGLLSGKYSREDEAGTDGRRASFDFPPVDRDRAYDAIDVMREIAAAHGATVPQIAIAWLLKQDVTTSVIVGAKRKDQLDDNLGACGVALTDADMEKLDTVSQLPKEYPGWMFERQGSYRDPNA
ncbi:aldo/keto reductase [Parasphingopyxis marina]|uniref:Aldo/keto reductase n=1 Tax=Parasphingopyxis marina TaxID=2761622 RepID=A0A842HZQ0_9SPHN|nr:aldo/keto reductase [Parasphingopyxis marina]MBC2778676.1 aldo/keto reductase [Parasphingopyxis marina]